LIIFIFVILSNVIVLMSDVRQMAMTTWSPGPLLNRWYDISSFAIATTLIKGWSRPKRI